MGLRDARTAGATGGSCTPFQLHLGGEVKAGIFSAPLPGPGVLSCVSGGPHRHPESGPSLVWVPVQLGLGRRAPQPHPKTETGLRKSWVSLPVGTREPGSPCRGVGFSSLCCGRTRGREAPRAGTLAGGQHPCLAASLKSGTEGSPHSRTRPRPAAVSCRAGKDTFQTGTPRPAERR